MIDLQVVASIFGWEDVAVTLLSNMIDTRPRGASLSNGCGGGSCGRADILSSGVEGGT